MSKTKEERTWELFIAVVQGGRPVSLNVDSHIQSLANECRKAV